MERKAIITIGAVSVITGMIIGCKHEVDGALTDELLFRSSQGDAFTYYTGTPGITSPASASAHGDFRVRFNTVATAALDSTGKLPEGSSFPDGSVVVKDVYSGGTISQIVVMKKEPADPFAGQGWLWGEYAPDGTVDYSAASKGEACISCHSSGDQRDLVRVFDLH